MPQTHKKRVRKKHQKRERKKTHAHKNWRKTKTTPTRNQNTWARKNRQVKHI